MMLTVPDSVRIVSLSGRHDIWCIVDADDWLWLNAWRWNYGWHAKTKWKLYAKRNTGPARSTVYMAREILIRQSGCDAAFAAAHHGHHANGQSLDNRGCNLAWTTPAQNSAMRMRRADIPSLESILASLRREAA